MKDQSDKSCQRNCSTTKHQIDIGLKQPGMTPILATRKMTINDRLLKAIFGAGHKMVVLIPGESVGAITITEMKDHEIDQES